MEHGLDNLLLNLSMVPKGQGVIVLMRHSIRYEIAEGQYGFDIDLTPDGVEVAIELGRKIDRSISYFGASPLVRCLQTAEAIRQGDECSTDIVPEPLLGAPGAYFVDLEDAAAFLKHHKALGVVNLLLKGETPSGMRSSEVANTMLHTLFKQHTPGADELQIYVSHDTYVGPFIYSLMGKTELNDELWPKVLEGAVFWYEGNKIHWIWRGEQGVSELIF